jgi:hypothetical protein
MVTGDKFTGDKVTGDKVYGDKITNIQEAPKTKPTLPPHTPHNLPERTTSAERFVGRSQELEQLKRLLAPESSRAYLTGMGGVGKSELAIQHAYGSFALYRGGIVRLDARQGLDAMALQVVTFCRESSRIWPSRRTRAPPTCCPCVGASGQQVPTHRNRFS